MIILYSQENFDNIISGDLRVEHMNVQRSLDGTRNDVDLRFGLKYLRRLSPVSNIDSLSLLDKQIRSKLLSSYWIGTTIGVSGYYVYSDSVDSKGTEIDFGPTIRYNISDQLFIEATCLIQYGKYGINTVDPISGSNWYIPYTHLIGVKCLAGIGYTVELNRFVHLEPLVGYQIAWDWISINPIDSQFEPHERSHNLIMCVSFRYTF